MIDPRSMCSGVVPLSGRLEHWHEELCEEPGTLERWIDEHGSPVNVIHLGAMGRNAAELTDAAAAREVSCRVFFARKANKALSLVDEAKRLGLGVDVASERELRQVLERGFDPADVIVTAAVKPAALLRLCLEAGTTVAIDNRDELDLLCQLAVEAGARAQMAPRLAPEPARGRPPTRFGMTPAEILGALEAVEGSPAVAGVHFHLDGYDAGERVAAIGESLRLVDELRDSGHEPGFVDIGGGVPMSYLNSGAEWEELWAEHSRALAGDRDEITFDGHPLGAVYPYSQSPVRGEWLARILDASFHTSTVAEALRSRDLELRLEPGRALLDGCGMSVARVEFRKQRSDGTWLVGLAMNRTQVRSTSDDFMVDPLLLRPPGAGEPTDAIEAYLVGAYCIERELLSWRRFRFPKGVAIGDLVAFPNTAGYLMHILESASHQIPLARNLVLADGDATLDEIDDA